MNHEQDQPRTLLHLVLQRALHIYWRFVRGLTMGVRGIVLDGEGRVFLIRHTYVPGWHLPGGGVEVRESAPHALARELDEEAGICLAGMPQLHGVFLNPGVSRRDHVVVYIVRDFTVMRVKQPDWEIAEAGFFPLDALPQGTTAATRRRLAEVASGSPPSDLW